MSLIVRSLIARSVVSAIAAFAVAVVLLPAAGLDARAAGGTIRVVDSQQEVNYPTGVALSVTLEASADIVEVRVFYRPAGSRSWGYGYAEFDPGKRVVATQSVPVRQSTYIAPGADVEYFYEVRDSEGHVFRTDIAVAEYLDHRFNWQRVIIGPLELVYHDIDDSRIKDAERKLEEDLRRVAELLQLEQANEFKGVIYNSYADANAAFPVQSQTTTDHGTFAGYAFPSQGVFVGQGLDRRIIVHESAHLMMRDALGSRALNLPDWLNEGFATYMEPDIRVRSSAELYSRTQRLRAMQSMSGTPDSIPVFYQKSVSVVAHLIEVYGEDKFRLFIGEISNGRTVDAGLINVYGFDVDGLEASWAGLPIPDPPPPGHSAVAETRPNQTRNPADAETGRNTDAEADSRQEAAVPAAGSEQTTAVPATVSPSGRQSEDPSPFMFVDVWVLTGAALLAAGGVAARFAYNRLRSKRETPDSSSQDWN